MTTFSATRTMGVLLFPEFEPLDAFGPVEAFVIAEWPGSKPEDPRPFRVVTVAQALAPVAMRGGVRVAPDHYFAGCPVLDVLLVPGGPGARIEYGNAALLRFISARAIAVEGWRPSALERCSSPTQASSPDWRRPPTGAPSTGWRNVRLAPGHRG